MKQNFLLRFMDPRETGGNGNDVDQDNLDENSDGDQPEELDADETADDVEIDEDDVEIDEYAEIDEDGTEDEVL